MNKENYSLQEAISNTVFLCENAEGSTHTLLEEHLERLLDLEYGMLIQEDYTSGVQISNGSRVETDPTATEEVDMSNPENWKEGDLLTIIDNDAGHEFDIGEVVRYLHTEVDMFVCEHLDQRNFWYCERYDLKWHSRPTKT